MSPQAWAAPPPATGDRAAQVLDELEKPGAQRLKGIETIEFYYGDMDGNDTKVEVYGPLR